MVTPGLLVQPNLVLAAVIIPVLNNNTSLVNTGLWGFVFGLFLVRGLTAFAAQQGSMHLPGLGDYSLFPAPYRVLRPHRVGERGWQDLTALAFLLLSVGSWSDLGLPGIPWDQTQRPVSNLSHVPGVRAAGPEGGAYVADLCRSSGAKTVTWKVLVTWKQDYNWGVTFLRKPKTHLKLACFEKNWNNWKSPECRRPTEGLSRRFVLAVDVNLFQAIAGPVQIFWCNSSSQQELSRNLLLGYLCRICRKRR